MANVGNLLLEHLKRFQGSLERIESKLGELTTRQTKMHWALLERIEQRIDFAN